MKNKKFGNATEQTVRGIPTKWGIDEHIGDQSIPALQVPIQYSILQVLPVTIILNMSVQIIITAGEYTL